MAIMSKEYYADIESVYKKPEDYELAGKGNAYIRIDAEAKVTGTAVYTDDVDRRAYPPPSPGRVPPGRGW